MAKVRNIKVIKRSNIQETPRTKISDARKATRNMVETVGDWVAEVRERKSMETKAAVRLLFSPADLNET
jgi:hypothetical protein